MEFSSILQLMTPGLCQVRADSCHTTDGSKIPGGALGGWVVSHVCHTSICSTTDFHLHFFIWCCLEFSIRWIVLLEVYLEAFDHLHWIFIQLLGPWSWELAKTWKTPKWCGKMLPTTSWCHWEPVERCLPATPSLHLRWFERPPRCGMPREGGVRVGLFLERQESTRIFLPWNQKTHKKKQTTTWYIVFFGKDTSCAHSRRNDSKLFKTLNSGRVQSWLAFLEIPYAWGIFPGCVHGRLLANWNHRGLCKVVLS